MSNGIGGIQVTVISAKPLFYKEFGNLCPTKTNYDVSKRHKNTTGGSPPICGSPSVVDTYLTYVSYVFLLAFR